MLSFIFTPVVVQTGLASLAAHLLCHGLFANVLPNGPWTQVPSFTAHAVVCFPLMIYLTYNGMSGWFFDDGEDNGAIDHILGYNEVGSRLGQMVLGMMLFWDIPTTLFTPALMDGLMMLHHVGTAFIAAVVTGVFSEGKPVGSYYALFFLGVVEVSSIFLVVVDVFHPKQKFWFDYLNNGGPKFLKALNEVARFAFAIAFLIFRAAYFPYVQATAALPEFYHVATLPAEERQDVSSAMLFGVCFLASLFSLLQLYWGVLVMRQVIKALAPPPKKKAG